jgi:hypothetical protein
MTAEVGVLNKLAVALAADSTVTISTAYEKHKTFESADKLFELSSSQPIGVMFFGNGQFMDLPISILVKQFRDLNESFLTIADAKEEFLKFLSKIGKEAPESVRHNEILALIFPALSELMSKAEEDSKNEILESIRNNSDDSNDDVDYSMMLLRNIRKHVLTENKKLQQMEDAKFIGGSSPKRLTNNLKEKIEAHPIFKDTDEKLSKLIIEYVLLLILKDTSAESAMGLVFAGFGESEMLPSLHSCEVNGFFRQKLKYVDVEHCDIDREGTSASVFGFAQRDVMERFLYGFDDFTKKQVTQFSEEVFGNTITALLKLLESEGVSENVLLPLDTRLRQVTQAYGEGLEKQCFSTISNKGKRDIEDMIRFMPKPDLAEMAESLVNLTSIRRRVSKGMETVGGPVDVAVISKSEGFVWVKRKHYFDEALNHRFFYRNQSKLKNGITEMRVKK